MSAENGHIAPSSHPVTPQVDLIWTSVPPQVAAPPSDLERRLGTLEVLPRQGGRWRHLEQRTIRGGRRTEHVEPPPLVVGGVEHRVRTAAAGSVDGHVLASVRVRVQVRVRVRVSVSVRVRVRVRVSGRVRVRVKVRVTSLH